jgi:restriction system protein
MNKSKNDKRQKRTLNAVLEKGILATVIGVAFLLAPLFTGSSTMLKTLATGLRFPGWAALGIGMLLLCVYFILNKKAVNSLRSARDISNNREPGWATVNAATAARSTPITPTDAWGPAVFSAIEWRRFEAVCETLFAQAGFDTRSQSHGADGGVDIWLHSANAPGPVAVVQCKHWQGKPVGVKDVREFFGVMSSHQLKRGTYATTSIFTPDARQFAKVNQINLLDGPGQT